MSPSTFFGVQSRLLLMSYPTSTPDPAVSAANAPDDQQQYQSTEAVALKTAATIPEPRSKPSCGSSQRLMKAPTIPTIRSPMVPNPLPARATGDETNHQNDH